MQNPELFLQKFKILNKAVNIHDVFLQINTLSFAFKMLLSQRVKVLESVRLRFTQNVAIAVIQYVGESCSVRSVLQRRPLKV